MRTKTIILGLIALLFGACATVHSGQYASSTEKLIKEGEKSDQIIGNLLISGQELNSLKSDYFFVLSFTIENKSENWETIKNMKINFGNEDYDNNISIVSGKDLVSWHEAASTIVQINDWNTKVFFSSIVGLGGIGLGIRGSQSVQIAGGSLALIGLTSLTVNEISKQLDKIETAKIFPDTHLLSGDIRVAPGLFTKKWIVFNLKNKAKLNNLDTIYLEFKNHEGKLKKISLNFRPEIKEIEKSKKEDMAQPKQNINF